MRRLLLCQPVTGAPIRYWEPGPPGGSQIFRAPRRGALQEAERLNVNGVTRALGQVSDVATERT